MSGYADNHREFDLYHLPMDTTGSTSIVVTADAQNFYPEELLLVVTEEPGSIGLCTLSVGTNSPNYNNVLAATLITDLSVLGRTKAIKLNNSAMPAVPQQTDIKVKVSIAASSGGELRLVLKGFNEDL